LYCMNMLTVLVPKYDEFSVCGEHMAKKLWNSERSHKEIYVKYHVEQICFNLIMGAYSHNNNFGPQNYSQYNSVSHNPAALNYGSQPFNEVPLECSNSETLLPSSAT
jgi:hypothetical protein